FRQNQFCVMENERRRSWFIMIKETEGGTVCKDRRRQRCPARRGRTTSREEDRTARTRRDDGDAETARMAGTQGDDGDPEARATREKTSMTGED
ncbi:hypothetical protein PIB30_102610, partial [Stylosanthes scabra]|nr:hypothetical protein [Stylosanthes scabra]